MLFNKLAIFRNLFEVYVNKNGRDYSMRIYPN